MNSEDPWKPKPKEAVKNQQQQQQHPQPQQKHPQHQHQQKKPPPHQPQQKNNDEDSSNLKPLVAEERTLLPPPKPSQVSAPSTPLVEIPEDVVGPIGDVVMKGNILQPVDYHQHHEGEEGETEREEENDWEVLSSAEDRASHGSSSFNNSQSHNSQVFVPRAGSVRSITSVEHENSSHTTLSVPFKIPRTNSSSTLDSQDHALGPSGKGVLGVDYVEHVILPTDTLQGICIAYKVSATQLRRANHFSGTLLHSAPKKLVIPLSKQALRTGFIRVQDTDTKEYKLHSFLAEYPDINPTEAKAYLELADWELKHAIQSAKADREWENESEIEDDEDYGTNDDSTSEGAADRDGMTGTEKSKKKKSSGRGITLKSGQIGISFSFNKAGIPVLKTVKGVGASKKNKSEIKKDSNKKEVEKVKVHSHLPAIATKSVLPEDLVNAAPQHNVVGFELQDLSKYRQEG